MSHDFDVEAALDVPLREVSGLELLTAAGRTRLVAVGDHTPELAVAAVSDDGELGEWSVIDPREFAGPAEHAPEAQLEAVAADGSGRLFLLAEEPSRIHVVDLDEGLVVTSFRLDVAPIPELAQAWDAEPSSRGEGLLLLRRGHLLVAKEKDPAGLVELGPSGHRAYGVGPDTLLGAEGFELPTEGRLHALAWWPLPDGSGLADVSELAIDGHGGVWLLSDQSAVVARLALPLEPGAVAVVSGLRGLPKKARTIGKPEGLVVLPDGRFLVAGDRAQTGRALLRLAPSAPR